MLARNLLRNYVVAHDLGSLDPAADYRQISVTLHDDGRAVCPRAATCATTSTTSPSGRRSDGSASAFAPPAPPLDWAGMSDAPAFADRGSKADLEAPAAAFAPKFDEHGLIPAIAVDAEDGTVLMQAYMNREALAATLANGARRSTGPAAGGNCGTRAPPAGRCRPWRNC